MILQLKVSQVTAFTEKVNQEPYTESESRAIYRKSKNHGTGVKFKSLFFFLMLFNFNKFSAFMASLFMCIYAAVGMCRMDFEQYFFLNLELFNFMSHCL